MLQRTAKLPIRRHASFHQENSLSQDRGRQCFLWGKGATALSNHQNSPGKNHCALEKMLPVLSAPGTRHEILPISYISGRRHAYSCQEQWIRVEITVQHGAFSRLYEERVRFFVNSSFLATDVYAPIQSSEAKGWRSWWDTTKPKLICLLHLNTCKVHLIMILSGGTKGTERAVSHFLIRHPYSSALRETNIS